MVFVLDKNHKPLMPCTEKRARLLLQRGRARVHRIKPFVIRLVDRTAEESALQPVRLKIDPGETTGFAAVLESERPKVLALAEVRHRSPAIREAMKSRATRRRFRRVKHRPYRARRFNNRPRNKCHVCGRTARKDRDTCREHAGAFHDPSVPRPGRWLAPSIRARVNAQESWVRRFRRWLPVTAITVENVRFDTRKLADPEVSGVEYQQGTLQGCEVREYLLERDGRKCWWCGAEGVPLNIDHVIPTSRGGTDRVLNLVLACRACNEDHDKLLPGEWAERLRARRDDLSRKRLDAVEKWLSEERRPQPLRDAASINSARWELWERLRATGLPVESGSGGRTKWNRTRLGLPKTHALDALCAGASATAWADAGVRPLRAKMPAHAARSARRLGRRQLTRYDKHGFVSERRTRRTVFLGIRFGDLVRARGRIGMVSKAPTKARRWRGEIRLPDGGRMGFGRREVEAGVVRPVQRADGYEHGAVEVAGGGAGA